MSATVPQPHHEQPTAPPHPEEMRANFNLRLGEKIALQGSARWTPAGVVTAELMGQALFLG